MCEGQGARGTGGPCKPCLQVTSKQRTGAYKSHLAHGGKRREVTLMRSGATHGSSWTAQHLLHLWGVLPEPWGSPAVIPSTGASGAGWGTPVHKRQGRAPDHGVKPCARQQMPNGDHIPMPLPQVPAVGVICQAGEKCPASITHVCDAQPTALGGTGISLQSQPCGPSTAPGPKAVRALMAVPTNHSSDCGPGPTRGSLHLTSSGAASLLCARARGLAHPPSCSLEHPLLGKTWTCH